MDFKKNRFIYLIITIIFLVITFFILWKTDLSNNVMLSKSIQIIIILALIRISYGCTIYIRKQYLESKYSYSIIMNLGLLVFININILRHINLLIQNWNNLDLLMIYQNTIESFSFFAMLTLPCIIVLSIFCIITNIILIKKEGFSYRNLLGVFIGFLAIFGLFGSQTIYIFIKRIIFDDRGLMIKRFVDITINVTLTYFYTLIISTLYCNIKASRHIPKYDKDYVIILGCKIKKDGTLTPLLKSRVDKAIEFSKAQKKETGKDLIFVPSGGKGDDEVTSEAEAMRDYLIKQGIDKKNIIIEDKSTNTFENMKYSNNIIIHDGRGSNISFSTTNYHVFRSGVVANKCGIECEGMGSKTKWYFYTNALIREFIANLVQERKKHILLLLIMNVIILGLVLIGYYYHLFEL